MCFYNETVEEESNRVLFEFLKVFYFSFVLNKITEQTLIN